MPSQSSLNSMCMSMTSRGRDWADHCLLILDNSLSAKIGHEKKYSNGIDFSVIKTLHVTKNCNLTDNQIKKQKILCAHIKLCNTTSLAHIAKLFNSNYSGTI